MISKSLLKQIKSLELRKFRKESGLFVAEGGKTVQDLIDLGLDCTAIIATEQWLKSHKLNTRTAVSVVSEEDIKKASFLRTPQGVLALFKQQQHIIDLTTPERELCLALDNIQDPGNMGTIIRIADWFGIKAIFATKDTVDVFNPKVVQATMGAIFRVKLHYVDLPELSEMLLSEGGSIYGTFLDGENIYSRELKTGVDSPVVIVIGNESEGISDKMGALVSDRLYIPPFPADSPGSESLNAAIATAITVAEFRRRI